MSRLPHTLQRLKWIGFPLLQQLHLYPHQEYTQTKLFNMIYAQISTTAIQQKVYALLNTRPPRGFVWMTVDVLDSVTTGWWLTGKIKLTAAGYLTALEACDCDDYCLSCKMGFRGIIWGRRGFWDLWAFRVCGSPTSSVSSSSPVPILHMLFSSSKSFEQSITCWCVAIEVRKCLLR